MQIRKFILTIGLLTLLITESLSCICDLKPDFKTPRDLAEYDFISLVRILRVDSVQSREISRFLIHQIDFQILELFKGNSVNNILVDGGHKTLKKLWTSCDLGEDVGEEWVIFAYMDKQTNKLITHLCTRSFRYKESNGHRYNGYGDEITTIDKLNALFNKNYVKPTYSGVHIEYYSNGQKELEEFYKKGKLHGQRVLWYPDGQIECRLNFKNGKRHGAVEWYSENSQLTSRRKYKNGLDSDTSIHWRHLDTSKISIKLYSLINKVTEDSAKSVFSKILVWSKQVYNKKGEMIYSCSFERNGKLDRESFFTYKENEKKETTKYFHSNGKVRGESYRLNDVDFGLYREWDENGNLTKYWEYDHTGTQINESVKIFKK